MRFQPARNHRPRQFRRRPLPQRKHRRDAGACELRFAIGADVGEIQVAEDHVGDAVGNGPRDGFAHSRLVDLVRAGIGDRHDPLRQARGLALGLQDFLPHAVDRYPAEGFRHRGQRADYFELARLHHFMQRKRRVLAARPGDQRLRTGHQLDAGVAPPRLRGPLRRLRIPQRADPAQCSFGRALAALPGAVDRSPQRFVGRLAGEIHAADRLAQHLSRRLSARAGCRHRAERERRGVPARRARFLHGGCGVAAEQFCQPFLRERDHGRFALGGEIAAERAADVDRTQRRTADIGVDQSRLQSNCSAR